MLVNCKECGREVSDAAKRCPHCGAKVQKAKREKEEIQKANLFKRMGECVTESKKFKRIYLGSLIASCALALCFLIVMILSYATPFTFLYSNPCNDGYALIDELVIKSRNQYSVTIQGTAYGITRATSSEGGIEIIISSTLNGYRGEVEYRFEKDGRVNVYVLYNGYEFDYEIQGTEAVFVKAYLNYKPTSVTTSVRGLADTSIDLAEAVLDYVLAINGEEYDFDDILEDYSNYHDSLNGTRISSIVLMSIFTIVSVCGIVFLRIITKNKSHTELLQKDLKEEDNIENFYE